MNQGHIAWGSYGFYFNIGSAESALNPLLTAGSFVDMTLYSYDSLLGANGPVLLSNNDILGLRTINVGGVGETEIVDLGAPPSAVPVPPSMLLLAPGLFGLIGLRKKVG